MCTSNTARNGASTIALEIESHGGITQDTDQELNAHGDLA